MPDILLRKIPRGLLKTLKTVARRNGRSLQEELHRILRSHARDAARRVERQERRPAPPEEPERNVAPAQDFHGSHSRARIAPPCGRVNARNPLRWLRQPGPGCGIILVAASEGPCPISSYARSRAASSTP